MRRWLTLAGVALFCVAVVTPARSQVLPQAPAYKYPVTPNAGAWMICVKSYKGGERQLDPKLLAEELADYLREEYKLPSYIFDWGWKQRAEEQKRVNDLKKQYDDFVAKMGTQSGANYYPKRVRYIDDEYAVLVGGWKDMETARKALDQIRKLKPPPDKLVDKVVQASGGDKKAPNAQFAPINPFLTALVVPNPTIPRQKAADDDKPDALMKELNDGRKYNVLACRKDWTLVVKEFKGTSQVQSSSGGGLLRKLGLGGPRTGEVLNASAAQCEELARVLREMKPSFESYVLHTRHSSILCVGQFDSLDDPKMQEAKLTLSKLQLNLANPDPTDANYMQLNPQPLPMKIPRF